MTEKEIHEATLIATIVVGTLPDGEMHARFNLDAAHQPDNSEIGMALLQLELLKDSLKELVQKVYDIRREYDMDDEEER